MTIAGGGGTLAAGGAAAGDRRHRRRRPPTCRPASTTRAVTFTNLTDGDGDTTRPAAPAGRLAAGRLQLPPGHQPRLDDAGPVGLRRSRRASAASTASPTPPRGYTGTNVYGYNLAGDYANNLPEYHLTTTALDCSQPGRPSPYASGAGSASSSRSYDHAYVRVSNDGVNWTTVWQNGAEITDAAWQLVEYDLGAVADGQPTVYLRWTMGTTDSSWHLLRLEPRRRRDPRPARGRRGAGGATCPRRAPRCRAPRPIRSTRATEVRFELAAAGPARLEVLDTRGRPRARARRRRPARRPAHA